jgi:formate transporter
MSKVFGFDAFAPGEIAERVGKTGVAKARLPLLSMLMLVALVYHVIYRRGADRQ